jgi:DNA repair protein RecO (recombination protein O)
MPLVTTEAVVLHAFNYLESSRIYRLATREAGVLSVLAKGARRARTRYGSAVDLFAQGEAQIYMKPNRELQNLAGFDVTRSRAALAEVPGRFTAAAALGELVMRFGGEEPSGVVFESLVVGLDAVAGAPAEGAADAALGAAWHLIAQLGFSPAVDLCSACHRDVPIDEAAPFSHPGGGVLCVNCAGSAPGARRLPASARSALRSWLAGDAAAAGGDGDDGARRAHQRLLREFLGQHLADGRELRAFAVWERGGWDAA